MQLGYTIPLQRHLAMKPPPYGAPCDLRFCWDLHIQTIGGRDSLFAVHASSRYAILLYDMNRTRWAVWRKVFLAELRHCLLKEGFSSAEASRYIMLAGPVEITRTHGRRAVAFLNQAVDALYALPVPMEDSSLLQPHVSYFLNDIPCRSAGYKEIDTGRGFLHRDLSALLAAYTG